MNLSEASDRAMEIRRLYERYEEKLYGHSWTRYDIAVGFVGDMGDLMKLVQAQNGIRTIPDSKDKLAHELSDCLWSILVLAKLHDINIENAFSSTMDELEGIVSSRLTD